MLRPPNELPSAVMPGLRFAVASSFCAAALILTSCGGDRGNQATGAPDKGSSQVKDRDELAGAFECSETGWSTEREPILASDAAGALAVFRNDPDEWLAAMDEIGPDEVGVAQLEIDAEGRTFTGVSFSPRSDNDAGGTWIVSWDEPKEASGGTTELSWWAESPDNDTGHVPIPAHLVTVPVPAPLAAITPLLTLDQGRLRGANSYGDVAADFFESNNGSGFALSYADTDPEDAGHLLFCKQV